MLRKVSLFSTSLLLALTAGRAFWVWLGENPFNMSGHTYVEFFQQLDKRIVVPIAITGIGAPCWRAYQLSSTGRIARRSIRHPRGAFVSLLALVDKGDRDNSALLIAERDRLQREIDNLLDLAAETIAPKVRERQAKLEQQLKVPRQAPPNLERLREALLQRAEEWRAELRAEPHVARLLLRRLVGPLKIWDAAEEGIAWEAAPKAELLDGLAPIHVVASPTGFEPVFWP
jgi:hypothetical protein